MTVSGKLFAPGHSAWQAARLERRDGQLLLRLAEAETKETFRPVTIRHLSGALPGVDRRIELEDGWLFITPDQDRALESLLEQGRRRWMWKGLPLDRLSPRGLLLLAGLTLLTLGLVRFGLPAAADGAAFLVPGRIERSIGKDSFASLENVLFNPTTLSPERQTEIQALFRPLAQELGRSVPPQLLFRNAPTIGANAMAFPGGPVVMTDGLVRLAHSDAEIAGVLAHELGHIRQRHSLRLMMRSAAGLLLLDSLLDDPSSLSELVTAFAGAAIASSYSRDFEAEADQVAIELLLRNHEDPAPFADMLATLQQDCGEKCEGRSWFSTHPATADRIQAIRAAAITAGNGASGKIEKN